jgi:hypothetical protein
MPIEVLEGRIMGERLKPVSGYVRKPGVTYAASTKPPTAADTPESRAGGVEAP